MRFAVVAVFLCLTALSGCGSPDATGPDAGDVGAMQAPDGERVRADWGGPDAAAPVPANLAKACAWKCELEISCGVTDIFDFDRCNADCLLEWQDCEYLEGFVDCVDGADDVCVESCEKMCD